MFNPNKTSNANKKNLEQLKKQINKNIPNQKQFRKGMSQENDKKLMSEGVTILRNCTQMHTDTIQDMEFVELGNEIRLISVSWDKSLIIWNCQGQPNYNPASKNINIVFLQKIDLGCYGLGVKYYQELGIVLISCGDCTIKILNLQTQELKTLINLPALALDFFYIPQMNSYIIVTLDGNISIYNANNLQQPISYKLPEFPLSADINEDIMIIAMNNNSISIFFINMLFNNFNGNFILQKNLLESPISKIKLNKINSTFTAVSIDSRILHSEFSLSGNGQIKITSDSKNSEKTFLFMGHGIKGSKNGETLGHSYNINSLNFNSQQSNFMASGSADGVVNFWDVIKKNKIHSFDFRESLSCGTISKSGRFAAYAIGYDWSKAYWDMSMAPSKPTIATITFSKNLLFVSAPLKQQQK